MNAINVKYVRSNEVNDIFSYQTESVESEVQYVEFPKTLGMTEDDVTEYLN